MIQECEHVQKLKTVIWKSPHFTFKKYVKNMFTIYSGKIGYKKDIRMFKKDK